ncbi:tetraprenyl-beta-curcumene synthase family protein [Desulfofundulus sp. TPOSR]|uniref:tetraprenyl-beta-curcumene synthase family protein n=1 Tax=Desulfofundulus sp. TPOSR TaxID=2714340 RepID=UPI00140946B8|nr:tetraprenyl-beta-curcumene synthase family protein [Desulfofundulus sp. TPOSR]NHM28594.1 tetraprenyl-beta-curcumene synthase family protein [Desulfofundulus sp. TPOSR]
MFTCWESKPCPGRWEVSARLGLMGRFLFLAFPGVARELKNWRLMASRCPEPHLRRMALASIGAKAFHCQGGSVFSAWTGSHRRELIRAIVALQTISDYLDNLCDRAGVQDGEAFHRLHRAFVDALCPGASGCDYYALYPYREDGGYLQELVRSCQQALARLPAYGPLRERACRLAELYCQLQVYKHIQWPLRVKSLTTWLEPLLESLPEKLYWWELAAATGSTIGIFALFALAARGNYTADEVERVTAAYFPWICGLHILLDYLIDQQEDVEGGDLNFVSYYQDGQQAAGRLKYFVDRSLALAAQLPDPFFHMTVVQGLLAMYLSDEKVDEQGLQATRRLLLDSGGPAARRLYRLCAFFRKVGIV